jgi:broad specificity phosphatase PhoE
MKNFTTIYIVRHGETEGNVQGMIQGQKDSPLTMLGEEQATALGKELSLIHFDEVFASDLGRTTRTAELIVLERKLAVKTTKILRERTFGQHEGRDFNTVFQKELKTLLDQYLLLADTDKMKYKFSEDHESDDELVARFLTFLREVGVAYPDKTILAVTHGGMIRALLIHLGFGTYKQIPHTGIKNASYIVLKTDGVEFEIVDTKGIEKIEEKELQK